MSQSLLFVVGVIVFTITVVGSLMYGYFLFDRSYQLGAVGQFARREDVAPTATDAVLVPTNDDSVD